MSHALNAGFGTGGPGSASPMASPAGFQPTMQPPGHMRPLTLDTLRRGVPEQSFASPTGISPAMNALAFTPPQSATDTTSPMSAVSDMSSFAYTHRALAESPRRNPFPGSVPGLSGQPSQYIPRMHIQDRFRRQSADAVSSPLRSSMSYGSLNMEDIRAHEHGQAATISEEPTNYEFQRDTPRNMPPPPLTPYGLGIPCKNFGSESKSLLLTNPRYSNNWHAHKCTHTQFTAGDDYRPWPRHAVLPKRHPATIHGPTNRDIPAFPRLSKCGLHCAPDATILLRAQLQSSAVSGPVRATTRR